MISRPVFFRAFTQQVFFILHSSYTPAAASGSVLHTAQVIYVGGSTREPLCESQSPSSGRLALTDAPGARGATLVTLPRWAWVMADDNDLTPKRDEEETRSAGRTSSCFLGRRGRLSHSDPDEIEWNRHTLATSFVDSDDLEGLKFCRFETFFDAFFLIHVCCYNEEPSRNDCYHFSYFGAINIFIGYSPSCL